MGLFIEPNELPDGSYGLIQVLFLGAVYGYILFNASNLISDGSELLLLVPSMAGIVGSVILPVLGAVPDGAIVLFSGMGPNAQEQMSVGVGALAGSTIMLLTIPWALSVFAGRVHLDEQGNGIYTRPSGAKNWRKLAPPGDKSLFHTGVTLLAELPTISKMMMSTSLIYLILQVPAFQYTGTYERDAKIDSGVVSKAEHPFALVAFIFSMIAFTAYLVWNVRRSSQVATDTIDEARIAAIRDGKVSLSGVLAEEMAQMKLQTPTETTPISSKVTSKRIEQIIRPFFTYYDRNKDKRMDADELMLFFKDMGEIVSRSEVESWIAHADKDKSGYIEFHELLEPTMNYLIAKFEAESSGKQVHLHRIHVDGPENEVRLSAGNESSDGEDEDEEEDVPEDLAHLSIREQQRRIKLRSAYMMFTGTVMVLVFSDPMVDVLSDVGRRTGIPAFYISFVVAPLASNASELIASYNYALKKTSKTISISISALLGAACMNNTFCLGIFAALMFFKDGLVWEFSAETLAILFVELVIGIFALRRTQRLIDAVIILMLYPLSILFVFFLENIVGLD